MCASVWELYICVTFLVYIRVFADNDCASVSTFLFCALLFFCLFSVLDVRAPECRPLLLCVVSGGGRLCIAATRICSGF